MERETASLEFLSDETVGSIKSGEPGILIRFTFSATDPNSNVALLGVWRWRLFRPQVQTPLPYIMWIFLVSTSTNDASELQRWQESSESNLQTCLIADLILLNFVPV